MNQQVSSSGSSGHAGSSSDGAQPQSFQFKYCRMCALELKHGGVLIFGEEGRRLQLPEKIRKTLSILVLEEDNLPKKICTDCCSSLEDYAKYKDIVVDAQEKLAAIAKIIPNLPVQANSEPTLSTSHPAEETLISSSSSSNIISHTIPKIKDFQPSSSHLSYRRCEFCGKRFTTKVALDRHLITEHSPAGSEQLPDQANNDEPDNSSEHFNGQEENKQSTQPKLDILVEDFPVKESPQEVKEVLSCSSLLHNQPSPEERTNPTTQNVSSDRKPEKPSKKEEDVGRPCAQCGKVFGTVAGLYQHQMSVHKGRRFKCDQCPNSYSQKVSLQNHIRSCHTPSTTTGDPENPDQNPRSKTPKGIFKCSQCPAVLSTKKLRYRHMQTHTTTRTFECPICHKFFKTSQCLSQHKTYHAPPKTTFLCSYCPKEFVTKYQLETHYNSHFNVRPIRCPFCDCGFNCYQNYTIHVKRKHKEVIVDGKIPKAIKVKTAKLNKEYGVAVEQKKVQPVAAAGLGSEGEKQEKQANSQCIWEKEPRAQQSLPSGSGGGQSEQQMQHSIPVVPMHEMVNIHTSMLQSQQHQVTTYSAPDKSQGQVYLITQPQQSSRQVPVPTTTGHGHFEATNHEDRTAIATVPSSSHSVHSLSVQHGQQPRMITTVADNTSLGTDTIHVHPQPFSSTAHVHLRQPTTAPNTGGSMSPDNSSYFQSISHNHLFSTMPGEIAQGFHNNVQPQQRPMPNSFSTNLIGHPSNPFQSNQRSLALAPSSSGVMGSQPSVHYAQRGSTVVQASTTVLNDPLNDLSKVVWTRFEDSPLELCVRSNESDNDTNFNQLVDLTSDKIVDLSGVGLIGHSTNQQNNSGTISYRSSLPNAFPNPVDLTDQQDNLQHSHHHQIPMSSSSSNLVDLSFTGGASNSSGGAGTSSSNGHQTNSTTIASSNNRSHSHFQIQQQQDDQMMSTSTFLRELLDLSCSTSSARSTTASTTTIDSYSNQSSQQQQQQLTSAYHSQQQESHHEYGSYHQIQQFELNLSAKNGKGYGVNQQYSHQSAAAPPPSLYQQHHHHHHQQQQNQNTSAGSAAAASTTLSSNMTRANATSSNNNPFQIYSDSMFL